MQVQIELGHPTSLAQLARSRQRRTYKLVHQNHHRLTQPCAPDAGDLFRDSELSMPELDANVLICGKIRNKDEFIQTLTDYYHWRNEGLIRRIVFSGWVSEWSLHRDLLQDMLSKGVEIILVPEPTVFIADHTFHQMTTLHYGLSAFEDDEFVFKTRTDKIRLNEPFSTLKEQFLSAPPPGPTSIFRHRVVINSILIFQPFFFNDMAYAGLAGDLRKLVSFDTWFVYQHTIINPEQILYSSPFIHSNPIIRDFFMANPGLIHNDQELSTRTHLTLLESPLYLSVLHFSLKFAVDDFVIGFHPMAPWQSPNDDKLSLTQLIKEGGALAIDGLSYQVGAHSIGAERLEPLPWLLNLPISPGNSTTILDQTLSNNPRATHHIFTNEAQELANHLNVACPELQNPPQKLQIMPGLRIYPSRTPQARPIL